MQNNTPSPQATQRESDEIDLLALLGALIDGKWIIIAFIATFGILGASYALLAPPIYQANSIIQIEEKSGGNLSGLSEISDMFGSTSKAVTEIELLKSRAVVGQAVENLALNISVKPKYFPVFGRWIASNFDDKAQLKAAAPIAGLNNYAWGGEQIDVFQLEVPDNQLGEDIQLIAGVDRTYAIYNKTGNLVLEGIVGEQASHNGYKVQISKLVANPGTIFLIKKDRKLTTIIEYQEKIGAVEKSKDSGIIGLTLLSDEPENAVEILNEIGKLYVRQNIERNSAEAAQSLSFIKEQLPSIRQELEKYEQALNDYQTSTKSVDISIETQAILDQIVALDTLISEQNLKRAEMERRFTRQHPSYQALLDQMGQLKSQKKELTSKVESLPETQQELLRLTRDVQVTTEVYTALLNRSQELDVMRAGTTGNVRIIDPAEVNTEQPVKPKRAIIFVISILAGAFIGMTLVLIRQALNRGIEDPELIEQLGLPVYAAIPFSKEQEGFERQPKRQQRICSDESRLLAANNPADLAVEALRSLRTSLHFARIEAKNNILMVTGPSPGVGKSFVSANLAVIMAKAGQRVLIIDGDMRKGYLNKLFKIPADNGLSELLAARISSSNAIHETEVENLFVVPRGLIPPNPSELLMHSNFESFLDNVKNEYDVIIIDTPPILAVTDAAIVGRHVGVSLIVTRFGVNTAKEIEVAKRRLEQNDILIKGAIFNAVEKRASASAYGNYGYYNYEYKSEKN